MGEADQRFLDSFDDIAKGGGITGLVWVDHMWDNQAWIARSLETTYSARGWAKAAKAEKFGGALATFSAASLIIDVTHDLYGPKAVKQAQTYTLMFRESAMTGVLEASVTVGKQEWDLGMQAIAGYYNLGAFVLLNTQATLILQF